MNKLGRKKLIVFLFFFSPLLILPGLYFLRDDLLRLGVEYALSEAFPEEESSFETIELSFGETIELTIEQLEVKSKKARFLGLREARLSLIPKDLSTHTYDVAISATGLDIKLDELQRSLKTTAESPRKESAATEEDSLSKLKNISLDVSLKDFKVHSEKAHATLALRELRVIRANFTKAFKTSLDLSVDYQDSANELRVMTQAEGKFDLSRFLKGNLLGVDLSAEVTALLNRDVLPALKLNLSGELGRDFTKGIALSAQADWVSAKTRIEANLKTNSFALRELDVTLFPSAILNHLNTRKGLSLGVNPEASLFAQGELSLTGSGPGGKLLIGTRELRSFNKGPAQLPLKDGSGEIEIVAGPKPLVKGNLRYETSSLEFEGEVLEKGAESGKLALDLGIAELAPAASFFAPEIVLDGGSARLKLTAEARREQGKILPKLSLKQEGEFTLTSGQQQKIRVGELGLSVTGEGQEFAFQGQLSGDLRAPERAPLEFALKGDGAVSQEKKIKAELGLKSWSQSAKSKGGSSQAKLRFVASEKTLEVSDLEAEFFLRDFTPFLPPELKAMIPGAEKSKVSLKARGCLNYADEKISTAQFELGLSEKLLLRKEGNEVLLEKFQAQLLELTEPGTLPLSVDLSASLKSKERSERIPVRSKLGLTVLLKETLAKKAPHLKASWKAEIANRSQMSAGAEVQGAVVKIDEVNGHLDLRDFLSFAPAEVKKLFPATASEAPVIKLGGALTLEEKVLRKFDFSLGTTRPLLVSLPQNIPGKLELKVRATPETIAVDSTLAVLEGKVHFGARSPGLRRLDQLSVKRLFPRELKAQVSEVKITRDLVRRVLYSEAPNLGQKGVPVAPAAPVDFRPLIGLPPFIVGLESSSLILDGHRFELSGDVSAGGTTVVSENFVMNDENGTLGLKLKATLAEQSAKATVKATIKGLGLASFSGLLPPIVDAVTGNADGDFLAVVSFGPPKQTEYRGEYQLALTNGEVRKLNLTEQLRSLFGKFTLLQGQADKVKLILTDKFDQLLVKGKVSNKVLILDQMTFTGIKNSLSLEGKGFIGQPGSRQRSELTFSLKDLTGKIGPFLKKELGREDVPVKLGGMEIDLSPDYKFTLAEVGGSALKQQLDKQLNENAEQLLGNLFGKKKKK